MYLFTVEELDDANKGHKINKVTVYRVSRVRDDPRQIQMEKVRDSLGDPDSQSQAIL